MEKKSPYEAIVTEVYSDFASRCPKVETLNKGLISKLRLKDNTNFAKETPRPDVEIMNALSRVDSDLKHECCESISLYDENFPLFKAIDSIMYDLFIRATERLKLIESKLKRPRILFSEKDRVGLVDTYQQYMDIIEEIKEFRTKSNLDRIFSIRYGDDDSKLEELLDSDKEYFENFGNKNIYCEWIGSHYDDLINSKKRI